MPDPASPEIIARVSESFEYWNDGEPQLMLQEYAEDGELDLSAVFTDMPVFRGHEGIRDQIEVLWETWEGVRMNSLEVFDVGGGRFVVEARWWGKGRRSGAEVDQHIAWLYTTREIRRQDRPLTALSVGRGRDGFRESHGVRCAERLINRLREPLPSAVLAWRAAHGLIAIGFLASIGYVWWCAITNTRGRLPAPGDHGPCR